ncbi:hypothetical protein RB200_37780 [Streptomyces sp. PmtG]
MSTAQGPQEERTASEPPDGGLTAQIVALQREIRRHLAMLRGEVDR